MCPLTVLEAGSPQSDFREQWVPGTLSPAPGPPPPPPLVPSQGWPSTYVWEPHPANLVFTSLPLQRPSLQTRHSVLPGWVTRLSHRPGELALEVTALGSHRCPSGGHRPDGHGPGEAPACGEGWQADSSRQKREGGPPSEKAAMMAAMALHAPPCHQRSPCSSPGAARVVGVPGPLGSLAQVHVMGGRGSSPGHRKEPKMMRGGLPPGCTGRTLSPLRRAHVTRTRAPTCPSA